jgi:hypothetical protein
MSTVDIGDAIELVFSVTPGCAVTVTWLDPAGTAVLTDVAVPEDPVGSGLFPYTLAPNTAGVWTAQFTASGAATAVERFYVRARPVVGSPAPLATVGDVAELFGTLGPVRQSLTVALLRHASRMIRSAFADVDARIAAGELDGDNVALAVVQMVLRVLRNPGGLRSETVGPFSRSWDTNAGIGLLEITPAETGLLVPPADAEDEFQVASTIWVRPGLAPPPVGLLAEGEARVLGW